LLHGALLYSSIRPEVIPTSRPLAQVPTTLGGWQSVREVTVEPEVQDILKADDLLYRIYGERNRALSLFVAGFKSQRTGKAPHSPKNCMPGSGWTPLSSREVQLDVEGNSPISVNRYVIEHGGDRNLVLYWYQSRDRVIADEFKAKFWVMVDAMRLNRTDTALVRIMVPIVDKNEEQAESSARDFVKLLYGTLRDYLPS
jgi:EpsI family protein